MKKTILLICTFLLVAFVGFAQKGSLSGVISDKATNENIPFATVALIKAGEENAYAGSVSTKNGHFIIEDIPYGSYKLSVSFIGYKSQELPGITITSGNKNIDMGTIALEPDLIGIEAVDVVAASRTSTNKIDRKTYQASDFETARGGTAIDVLSKLPSVSVSSENEISVRGSSDFVVYLNGKPANTSASVLLGQIPSENIKNIDIITVPSSRYNAQGKGGIINITTKRNTNSGLTVMATGMLGGTPWENATDVFSNHDIDNNRGNGGLSLNYNMDKLSLHGAVNYTNRHNKGIGDIYTYIYQDETQPYQGNYYILDGLGARPKWDENLYTNIGMDYKLGSNSQLSANYLYSKRHTGRAAHYKYDTFFSNTTSGAPIDETLYELYNPNEIHRRGHFQNIGVDYFWESNNNSALNISFLYEDSNLEQTIDNKEFAYTGEQQYYDYNSNDDGNPVFHSYQRDETPLDAYRFEMNYQKDFDNGNSLNLGAVSELVRLDGIYEYDTINISTGNFAGYDYFNNTIDLNRDIYAAFIEYSGTANKLQYILGVRFEYLVQQMNVSSTRYFEEVYDVFGEIGRDFNETKFKQNQFDIFPTLHLRYQATEADVISLAASHRVNRPPAKDMAPFLYRRHQEIFEMGDPLLEPEYSWNADLTYRRLLGKHSLSLTGFVRSTTNAIYRVNRLDYGLANKGGVLLRSFTNAGTHVAAGGELGLNFDISSKAKLFLGGSLYQFSVESNKTLLGDQSSSNSVNWDAKSNLSWTILAPLKFTIDYSYKSGTVTPQGKDLKFQMMNAALNFTPKQLQGWNFYAKMLDIIGTNQAGGYTGATANGMDVFQRDWVYDYEGQIVEIGASFTFNQRKEQTKQRLIGDKYF
ncbi:Outer membrane receptor proteins, mostly Fe transport [Mariniphaga anaerophila]|uniref:Outer membrane receptor proteins, mostly Fe transport n=1 Tax=Mariniphaga anaerophila TaxID=1484053 RepID=A0A1M4Y8H9_9BACT|nr:outer membrane beta-barrel family protein [Mariniphaga anaerophila]SHF02127.1 Outer membrane receptor proteins, mostly Fe transport [Mariniphaga anaerophila]